MDLFDEAELAAQIAALEVQSGVEEEPIAHRDDQSEHPNKPSTRRRGFSDKLKRVRIELRLSEAAKANGLEPYAYLKYVLDYIGSAAFGDSIGFSGLFGVCCSWS